MTAPSKPDEDAFARDLELAANGDEEAARRMWSEHYEVLRSAAKAWFDKNWQRRGDAFGISLSGTDIVNQVYERLHDRAATLEKGRAWFFRCFYTECLRIAVDHYRRTRNARGRGAQKRVELHSQLIAEHGDAVDPTRVIDALSELEKSSQRTAQVAMLKIFETTPDDSGANGSVRGLTNGEIADLLGCGLRTVEKDWAFAKSYLIDVLS